MNKPSLNEPMPVSRPEDDDIEGNRSESSVNEIVDPEGVGRPDWRTVCQAAARSAGAEEARLKWHVEPEAPLPFDFRWEHVQQVVQTALWLAGETAADREVAEAAAWLHDVRKIDAEHARTGAVAARAILEATDFPPAKIDVVCDAINQHEGLTRADAAPMQPLAAALLWDADKLSKIGVQALAYSLSTPRVQGLCLTERLTRARSFAETVLSETVTSMNTEPAQRLAVQRYGEMMAALDAWLRDARL